MKRIFLALTIFTSIWAQAQNSISYWQQHVDYKMEVDMNVKKLSIHRKTRISIHQ